MFRNQLVMRSSNITPIQLIMIFVISLCNIISKNSPHQEYSLHVTFNVQTYSFIYFVDTVSRQVRTSNSSTK